MAAQDLIDTFDEARWATEARRLRSFQATQRVDASWRAAKRRLATRAATPELEEYAPESRGPESRRDSTRPPFVMGSAKPRGKSASDLRAERTAVPLQERRRVGTGAEQQEAAPPGGDGELPGAAPPRGATVGGDGEIGDMQADYARSVVRGVTKAAAGAADALVWALPDAFISGITEIPEDPERIAHRSPAIQRFIDSMKSEPAPTTVEAEEGPATTLPEPPKRTLRQIANEWNEYIDPSRPGLRAIEEVVEFVAPFAAGYGAAVRGVQWVRELPAFKRFLVGETAGNIAASQSADPNGDRLAGVVLEHFPRSRVLLMDVLAANEKNAPEAVGRFKNFVDAQLPGIGTGVLVEGLLRAARAAFRGRQAAPEPDTDPAVVEEGMQKFRDDAAAKREELAERRAESLAVHRAEAEASPPPAGTPESVVYDTGKRTEAIDVAGAMRGAADGDEASVSKLKEWKIGRETLDAASRLPEEEVGVALERMTTIDEVLAWIDALGEPRRVPGGGV